MKVKQDLGENVCTNRTKSQSVNLTQIGLKQIGFKTSELKNIIYITTPCILLKRGTSSKSPSKIITFNELVISLCS